MSVEVYRESPGKFDSRTLREETLSRWTGRKDPDPDKDSFLNEKATLQAQNGIPCTQMFPFLLGSYP